MGKKLHLDREIDISQWFKTEAQALAWLKEEE